MGCCNNKEQQDDELMRLTQINSIIERKILLLGAGSSGKSTLSNQIRNIYGNDHEFKESELTEYKKVIYEQIVNDMINIIEFIENTREEQEYRNTSNNRCEYIQNIIDLNNHHAANLFINYFYKNSVPDIIIDLISTFIPEIVIYEDINDSIDYIYKHKADVLDKNLRNHIQTIWNKKSIKDLFKIRGTFKLHINDSSACFWDNIDRISDEKYIVTIDDILKSSATTHGIIENKIQLTSDIAFKITDVGGRRWERKKWIHSFENVSCIIFTASLSCYDEYLFEDEMINAMDEEIKLFEEICNSQWFRDTVIVLFLTKNDLFKQKIKNIPITVMDINDSYRFYDKYDDTNDYHQCLDFIKNIFEEQNKDQNKEIYIHIVNVLDKDFVEKVFNDVQRAIINASLIMGS